MSEAWPRSSYSIELGEAVINILIVEDHPLVRDGIKLHLSSGTEWVVCGETDNPTDALSMAQQFEPRLAIVDLSLKGGRGRPRINQADGRFAEAAENPGAFHAFRIGVFESRD